MDIVKEVAVGAGIILILGNSVNAIIIAASEIKSKRDKHRKKE